MKDVQLYPLAAVGITKGLYEVFILPELSAKRAWLAMGLGILAYELAAPPNELLSEGVDRLLDTKPMLARLAIGITAAHLCNLIPDRLDPFAQGLKLLKN